MIGNTELTMPQRLRALWALQVTGGFTESFGKMLLADKEAWLRAWSVQFLCEKAPPSENVLKEIARLARLDDAPIVRLYVASAMQRLPLEQRWDLASGLAAHPEQQIDPNLTCMIWFGIEPAIASDPPRSAALVGTSKLPKLQEFIARRMASINK
jgi:hypothetical protein